MANKNLANEVLNVCSEGKIAQLQNILRGKSHDAVKECVQKITNGTTPLIMACRNGHANVVAHLVKSCSVDIEQAGTVTFEGEKIEGAPPLWCAAAAGHKKIVQLLVQNGAKVNNTTLTNSTPLRAACFDGHLDIVKYLVENKADIEIANRHGHTCLMIACYKGHIEVVKYLQQKGADVNKKSLKGNTALHDCAESGSLEIMKLLFSHNAKMEKDSYGMTPLLSAAVSGRTEIVEYIISRLGCSRKDRIDALELLGATYVDKKRDMPGAINVWKKAMFERDRPPDTIPKPVRKESVAAYEYAVEVKDSQSLQDLIADPDKMRMQALLVRERILGQEHPDTSYYIRYRGAVYADMGNFERCIVLWTYALEIQQKGLDPLSAMTHSSLLSFAELFSFMMTNSNSTELEPIVKFVDMMSIYRCAIKELNTGLEHMKKTNHKEKDVHQFQHLLVIIMHLLALLCQFQRHLNSKEIHELKSTTYHLVKVDPRGPHKQSLLHLACDKKTSSVGRYPVCIFPSVDVIKVLIEVGADVNLSDDNKNSPLHIAAMNKPCDNNVIKFLLEKEAHLDACNRENKSALSMIESEVSCGINKLNYLSLQCLASKVIVKHNIPYAEVPDKLATFISMH